MQRLSFVAVGFLCVTAAAQQIQPQPISVGIVFDTSGSMGNKLRYSRELVGQFLKTARPQDEFFLIKFSDSPALASGFSADPDEIQNQLAFTQSSGRSALFDAIALAVHQMREATNSRKVLLVISDGGDNHSRYAKGEIEEAARGSGVRIYTVGMHESVRVRTPEEFSGPAVLDELSERTGGKYFEFDTSLGKLPDLGVRAGSEMRAPIRP